MPPHQRSFAGIIKIINELEKYSLRFFGHQANLQMKYKLPIITTLLLITHSAFGQLPSKNQVLWLDASDAATLTVEDDGTISRWADKSGTNSNAVQPIAERRPILSEAVIGGQNAIRQDVTTGMKIENLNLARPYSIFIVDQYAADAVNKGRTLQSAFGTGQNWLLGKWGGNHAHHPGAWAGVANGITAPNGEAKIAEGTGGWQSSEWALNGLGYGGNGNPVAAGILAFGSDGQYSGESSQAEIGEIIAYNRLLDSAEREQVTAYLGEKYSLPVVAPQDATRISVFTGADPGEGLDFTGNFIAAVEAVGEGGFTIGDATFTSDAGIITAQNTGANWGPGVGSIAIESDDDTNLIQVMNDIRWSYGNVGVKASIPGLTPGRQYKVQLLFADSGINRHFGVWIEGSRVAIDFNAAGYTGTDGDLGVALVHRYVAEDETLDIMLRSDGLGNGDINPIIQGITVEEEKDLLVTRVVNIDDAASLDFSGDITHAVNFGGSGGAVIGDAVFTGDTGVENVEVSAENLASPWGTAPDVGATAEDDALEEILHSIRWQGTNSNTPGNDGVHVRVSGLTEGEGYKLQLLFGERGANRGFDVTVNGVQIADEFTTNQGADQNFALLHYFIADSSDAVVHLSGIGASFADRNPILNGLTLEEIGTLDNDQDGLHDGWEEKYFNDLAQGANDDPDQDNLTNLQEIAIGTDPTNADTDGDDLEDGVETNTGSFVSTSDTGTSPTNADTDGDKLNDGAELDLSTNPFNRDSDADGWSDSQEVALGSDPNDESTPSGLQLLGYWNFDDISNPAVAADQSAFNQGGAITGGALFSASGEGHSARAGDHAINLGSHNGGQTVQINSDLFNVAGAKDTITFSFWQKDLNTATNTSSFILFSPTVNRAMHGHVPWSDGNIYFDGPNCCGDGTRISGPGGLTSGGWTHFVFEKDGATKRVWVNGVKILEGGGQLALPTDSTELWIGSERGTNSLNGFIDEFAVFDGPLNEDQITLLSQGIAPNYLVGGDSDGDGLNDNWENDYFGNLDQDSAGDADEDGLSNAEEFALTSDPTESDTDNDGLSDGDEITAGTDIFISDTDGDGLADGVETNTGSFVSASDTGTDPLNADSDGDTAPDGTEVSFLTDPNDEDDRPVGITELNTISVLPSGSYDMIAGSRKFSAYVENDGTHSWLLVGRGRQGWEFDNDGQGTDADLSDPDKLGTPAAFVPAAYDAITINELIANSGGNLTDLEIRLKRASNPQGSVYSEMRWRPISDTNWRWNFDAAMTVDQQMTATGGIVGGAIATWINCNSRDCLPAGNDGTRVFTFAWAGHASQKGFSYGNLVVNGANNATSFLWENGDENHAIPYTEVYIRMKNPAPVELADTDQDGIADLVEEVLAGDLDELTAGDDDGDGLNSPDEINTHNTNPLAADSDGDNLNDGTEIAGGTNPNKADSDADGISDDLEIASGTNPNKADGDDDGWDDLLELAFGSDPNDGASQPSTGNDLSLLGYWDFDDITDPAVAIDKSPFKVDGSLINGAVYSADGEGHSASFGDFSLNLGTGVGAESVKVVSEIWQVAGAQDAITFSFWQKNLNTATNTSSFLLYSPSVNLGRGMHGHVPWSNGNIYFDGPGCCTEGTDRLSGPGGVVAGEWTHFVFQKNGPDKQVWRNGNLILNGTGHLPLPRDMSELWIGSNRGTSSPPGYIDEFAIFDRPLTEEQIVQLAAGTPAIDLVVPPVDLKILEIVAQGAANQLNSLAITFASNEGVAYAVDFKESLDQPFWEELDDNVIGASGTTIWEDTNPNRVGQVRGFYRVRNTELE